MSRLTTMSPEALKQILAPESDSDLFQLLTFYDEDNSVIARITNSIQEIDGQALRLSERDSDIIYGVISRGQEFMALDFRLTLPSEEEANAPRCSLSMNDVTRYLIPIIRNLSKPPRVRIELVLSKSPDDVEIEFDDFFITSFNYNAEQVTAELSMISLQQEPFPMYSFTPQFNPGLY